MISRIGSQARKCLVHSAMRGLTDHSLRLFDDDPAPQCGAQLVIECLCIQKLLMLDDGDRCNIGKTLSHRKIVIVQITMILVKKIEYSEDVVTDSQR